MTVQLIAKPSRDKSWKASWPIDWDRFPAPQSEAEAATLVVKCQRRLDRITQRVEAKFAKGQVHAGKSLTRRALWSKSAMVAAVAHAVARKGLLGQDGWSAMQIILTGLILKMDDDVDESICLYWKPKFPEGVRPILRFGPLEYARQYLAKRLAIASGRIAPTQFAIGRGTDRVADWLAANVTESTVVLTTDVPSCFLVLDHQRLKGDGLLPPTVLEKVAFEPMTKVKWVAGNSSLGSSTGSYFDGCGAGSGRGIPPGSALSSAMAEIRLRSFLETVEETAGVELKWASYADNLIFLVSSQAAALALKSALLKAALPEFGQKAANELCTRTKATLATDGFHFIGSDYRLVPSGLKRRVPEAAGFNYGARLAQDIQMLKLSPAAIRRRVQGWALAHQYDPRAEIIAAGMMTDFCGHGENGHLEGHEPSSYGLDETYDSGWEDEFPPF